MRSIMLTAVLAVPLAGLPLMVGCDREVESSKSVEVKDDGTKVTKETTVSETADGGVKKVEEHSVDRPDPVKKTETETTVKTEDGTVKKEETKTVDR